MEGIPEFQGSITVRFRTLAVREWTVWQPKAPVEAQDVGLFFNNLQGYVILAPVVHTLLVQWI